MPLQTPELFSVGQIARRYRVSIRRARYAIEAAQIDPAVRVGNAHGYTADQLPSIDEAIRRLRPRKAVHA